MSLSNRAGVDLAATKENNTSTQRSARNGNSLLFSQFRLDLQSLGSERHVSQRLAGLSSAEQENLKGLCIRNKHPRFEKEFVVGRHQPFGKTSDYIKSIENADSEKMAKLVKLVGMLLQTKRYLFWSKIISKNRGIEFFE